MNAGRTEAVSIPPELQRSVPREVALTRAGKALRGVTIALLLGAVGMGVGLCLGAIRGAERLKAIQEQSAVTQGQVVGWGRVREGKRVVSYTFQFGGREYAGRTELQTRHWRGLPPGTSVAVRYLPANPQENWMVGHE